MALPEDQDFDFHWLGLTMAGSLHVPPGEGPHPAVLMLQGSGPADRDSDGYFVPIRDAFLAQGIAVYAFDKPGCGDSTGDWRDFGLDERADQAAAAIGALRSHHSIDDRRVGVWGQSQGGWLAQMLAARSLELAFAIANSGPSINPPQQDLYGCEHTMRRDGRSEDEIERALDSLSLVHEAAAMGTDYATIEAEILRPARTESWYGYHTIDDEKDWELAVKFAADPFEPVEALAGIQCRFLAVYGGRDVLVPAWQSAEESGRALARAATDDATVVVFPNGDHRIKDGASGEFVAGYLDLLSHWTARRAGVVTS